MTTTTTTAVSASVQNANCLKVPIAWKMERNAENAITRIILVGVRGIATENREVSE